MPQNAIIRADGTGDYTSLIAWEAAEQSADYGAVTTARLDGFFDLGAAQLDINGTWPNGFRIECFDSADAFDGTERKLCGITSTASITLRNRGHSTGLSGIEVYNTGTGIAYSNTVVGGNLDHQGCLFRTESNTAHRANTTLGAGTSGCVTASLTGNPNLGGTYNQCSMFTTLNSAIGSSATTTIDNTVIVNLGTGACFRGTVTQNNNASTDATADTLTNIVIADNFVSATPVASGDYRIKLSSPLDTNNIGPFVESGGGPVTTPLTLSYSATGASMLEEATEYSLLATYSANASSSLSKLIDKGLSYTGIAAYSISKEISTTKSYSATGTPTEEEAIVTEVAASTTATGLLTTLATFIPKGVGVAVKYIRRIGIKIGIGL